MVRCGVVFMQAGHERRIPVKNVRVAAEVVDFVSEVKVTQVFENTERQTIEAHYIFPMDAGAAVNGLEIKVDGRVIKGVVQEKEEAKRTYDTAKAMGHGAYLVQESAISTDVFKTSLGNLRHGTMVEVTISYVAEVPMEGPNLRFTLPATVAPRYTGSKANRRGGRGRNTKRRTAAAAGAGAGGAAPAGDAAMSTAPVMLDFAATFSLPSEVTSVTSPSHARNIKVELGHDDKPSVARVTFQQGEHVHLDQDLVLIVAQAQANRPHAFVETLQAAPADDKKAGGEERKADASTAVLVGVYPDKAAVGADDEDAGDQACEVVFVVDRSGSMRGNRMDAAKRALQVCLRSLPEGSLFQIVSFGSRHTKLFEAGSSPYNDATLAQATHHVDGMSANYGGTEIWAPLEDVFSTEAGPAKPRQVLLFTDGQVGDTASVVQLVKNQSVKTGVRCFAFGIGSGVSHALVDGVASVSGGAAEYILGNEELTAKVMRQLGRALEPAITDAKVDWGDLQPYVDASAPVKVRAAHAGTRVTFYARLRGEWPASDVSLSGDLPSGPVKWTIRVTPPGQYAAGGGAVTHVVGRTVHTAFARSRIRDLELLNVPAAKPIAVGIGKEFGVASKWTSFVAIEYRDDAGAAGDGADTAVRTVGSMTQIKAPVNRPRGGRGGRGGRKHPKRERRMRASVSSSRGFGGALAGTRSGGGPRMYDARAPAAARSGGGYNGPALVPAAPTRGFGGSRGVPSAVLDSFGKRRTRSGMLGREKARAAQAPPVPVAEAYDALAMPPPPPAGLVRQTSAERAAAAGNLFAAMPTHSLAADEAEADVAVFDDDSDDDVDMRSERKAQTGRKRDKKGKKTAPRVRGGVAARARPVPQAAPAAAGTMDTIVRAQKANGTWDLAAVAALVPGKSQAAVLASVPAGAPADAWATALMLAVLKLHFAAKSAEWKILARKGRRGLTAALGAATADVVAAAEAFVVG